MREKLFNLIDKRFLPRWIVLVVDFMLISFTFIFTYLLRFNLVSTTANVPAMLLQLVAGVPFFFLAAYLFRPHENILRHSTIDDAKSVAGSHLVFSFGLILISWEGHKFHPFLTIPYSIIVVHYFVSVFALVLLRFSVHQLFHRLKEKPKNMVNIMIYGAGKLGSMAHSLINKDDKIHYNVVGFVDDNSSLWNNRIEGVKIYPPDKVFDHFIHSLNVKEMILAISATSLENERKREIVDTCLSMHLKVRELPDPTDWLDGKFSENQIRNVRIEDLLGRESINLNVEAVRKGISQKTVMITGGAGSIGSEIVRQLVHLQPKSIIIVDQAESALFDIQQEILPHINGTELHLFVADTTNRYKMHKIFRRTNPHIIYHAAAYKHVPLMEVQPFEAVNNNVGGTKNLADLAVEFNVEKFVLVSTDKAVNPSNVMGASKRLCELYIQSLSRQKGIKTHFITTRFGNVLGSNGSVIPLFKKQISTGGPVTVTDKRVYRYFMTIPEACQLVMEAGFMGAGGEIYLFDMGKPVRIYDLAEKMISLSGYVPHEEIKIVEIGLRPGEKLFEELLVDQEESFHTTHKKIMIARIRPYPYQKTLKMIDELLSSLTELTDLELVTKMKMIVPEFLSNNSKYEALDIKPEDQKAV